MADSGEKGSNPTKYEAGMGVFRDQSFTPEFITAWLALNTEIARENLKRMAKAHGVEADLSPATGMYSGDLEPAFVPSLFGKIEKVKGIIAEWGKCHDQKSIRMIYPDTKNGMGFRATITPPQPLSPLPFQRLASILKQERQSATFISNEDGFMVGIEYWGTSENERMQAQLISLFVEQVVLEEMKPGDREGFEGIKPEYEDGYVVEDINETDYDRHIKASTPKRNVKAKSCLKSYKSPS